MLNGYRHPFLVGILSGLGLVFASAIFSGKVVAVADGDTISVMQDGKAVKIRLYGIDSPEKGQPFGTRAKELAGHLAFGKEVKVEVVDTDHYGRMVARVFLPDGRQLNQVMVQEGLAWWYKQYARKDSILAELEAKARKAKVGIWSHQDPIAPWEWRKRLRDERREKKRKKLKDARN